MALNFSASQYEKAFTPTTLCNWTIPRKSVVPKQHTDVTKIISNDRGHLLPGIKKSSRGPWALYQGTYQLPRRITKKIVNEMTNEDILSSWEKRSAHIPVINRGSPEIISKQIGDSDVPTNEGKLNGDVIKSITQDTARDTTSRCSTSSSKSNHKLLTSEPVPAISQTNLDNEPVLSEVYNNDLVAKHLKQSNQKHHRLADAVEHNTYVDLQMKRNSNPGLSLSTEPISSAIGCKIFHSPGPTQCSKLKVFRPKTASPNQKSKENDTRPKTTSCVRRKCKPLSEMDLAIYWDIPASEELKNCNNPAPAVFTMVPVDDYQKEVTDAEIPSLVGSETSAECKKRFARQHTNPSAVMNVVDIDSENKPTTSSTLLDNLERKRDELPSRLSKRHSSTPSLHSQKTSNTKPETCESLKKNSEKCLNVEKPDSAHKRCKSTPHLANIGVQVNIRDKFSRPCVACEWKRSGNTDALEKQEYKSAFKAGKPNNFQPNEEIMERIQKSKTLRVPKPKIPFIKKNYTIGTLAPPFSVWPKTAGNDYPDHWRLASVYQHSYKTPEARKVPLIKTVFQ